MIGQQHIRLKAGIAIGAALAREEPLPHALLTGPGGTGKTSFAQVLANEMYAPFTATTGQCLLTPLDLRNLLIRIKPRTVVLVDEAHTLGRSAAEELLVVLEDGVINLNGQDAPVRIPVPPFTLVAATTKPEVFCSTPLGQRFGLHFHFDFYSANELQQLVSGIFTRWGLTTEPGVAGFLAARARGTPRIALRLAERVRDVTQARGESMVTACASSRAMQIEGIDHLGLVPAERKVLERLKTSSPRPTSARTLATALGVRVETIENFEQVLIRFGLVEVGPGGRRITPLGMTHIDQVAGRR